MATKLINGKHKTVNEVVIENIGLVRRIAHKYRVQAKMSGIEFEDLENIGAIGLMKAFNDFDEKREVKFSSYAYHKIIGEITRVILKSDDKDVHYTLNVKIIANKLLKLDWKNKEIDELADELNVSSSSILSAIEYLNSESIRLESEVKNSLSGEKGETTFHEIFGVYQDQSVIFVSDFLSQLSKEEREVAERIVEGENQRDIARSWGVSRTVVWNHLQSVKEKLRKYIAGEKIEKEKKNMSQPKVISYSKYLGVVKERDELKKQFEELKNKLGTNGSPSQDKQQQEQLQNNISELKAENDRLYQELMLVKQELKGLRVYTMAKLKQEQYLGS